MHLEEKLKGDRLSTHYTIEVQITQQLKTKQNKQTNIILNDCRIQNEHFIT